MTSYNKKNITVNIDQDPINQLVLMLQTSYNFKSSALVQQPSTHLSLTYLSPAELQEPVNTIYNQKFKLKCISKFCNQPLTHLLQKYIQKNEEVRSDKISPTTINTELMASWPLKGSMKKLTIGVFCIKCFYINIKLGGSFC